MRLIQAILLLYLGLGYTGVVGWYPDVAWLQRPFWALAWPLAVLAFGLSGLALAPRVRRRDPALVGWALLSLCGCLTLPPLILAKSQQAAADTAARSQLTELRDRVQVEERRREQIRREAARAELAARPRDRFSVYEGRLDAASLQAIRALDERMQREVSSFSASYEETMQAHPVLGPSAWITFQSLGQLEAEQLAHQRLYEATRAFTRFIETFESTYTEAIQSLQLKPPADRVAIAELQRILQSWEDTRLTDLRQLDVEVLASALRALDILQQEWGRWSYNPREQALLFDNPSAEDAFQEAMHRFQAAMQAVQAIRQDSAPNDPEDP